jgi:hypothetical protein
MANTNKVFIKTADISQFSSDPIRTLTREFFADAPLNQDVKIEKRTDGRVLYKINTRLAREIAEINRTINTKYLYHNFSYFLPSSAKVDAYSYEISNITDSSKIKQFSEEITSQNVSKEVDIKNFYILGDAEAYYQSGLKPQPNEAWGDYKVYFLSDELIKNNDYKLSSLKHTPIYTKIIIPPIEGLQTNDTLFSLLGESGKEGLFKTKDSRLDIDVDRLIFLNFLSNFRTPTQIEFAAKLGDQAEAATRVNLFSDTSLTDARIALEPERRLNLSSDFALFEPTTEHEKNVPFVFNFLKEQLLKKKTQLLDIYKKFNKTDLIPIFYKINKYPGNFTSPIQSFYLPYDLNSSIEFIDNQILPDKRYRYTINLVCIASGFSYGYKKVTASETDGRFFETYEINEESVENDIRLVELGYINDYAIKTLDMPKVPEANIVSLIGEANKLKIMLNVKSAVEKPIFITNEEKNSLQDLDTSKETLNFIDGDIKEFVVYRLEAVPTSYESFATARVSRTAYKNNSFFDAIENNKKYYYMFRTTNGKYFSNPSEVYEVEIKNDNGYVIPSIKTYSFTTLENRPLFLQSREFSRFITIKPSFYQLNLVEKDASTESFLNSSFIFDLEKFKNLQSIFQNASNNPKYKIRLTSKISGKMLDINLNYKYKIVKPER